MTTAKRIALIVILLLTSCVNVSLSIPFYNKVSQSTTTDHSNTNALVGDLSACSGEFDFDCGPGELRRRCISGLWMCDHIYDCTTGRDEVSCKYQHECPRGFFSCRNGDCILASKRCDGVTECLDGSDERACLEFPPILMNKSAAPIDSGKNTRTRPSSNSKAPTAAETGEHQTSAKEHKAEALENNDDASGPSILLILFGLALFAVFVLIATYCTLRKNPNTAESFDQALKEFGRKVSPSRAGSQPRSVNILSSPSTEQFFDNPMNTMQNPLVLSAATIGVNSSPALASSRAANLPSLNSFPSHSHLLGN